MWFFLWKCVSYTMLLKLCICFGICVSSKWFHLRLTFSLLKPWANNKLNKAVFISTVFWRGEDTPHAILSQKCILWEKGLMKLLQPWGDYLVNNFPTDIKQLAKTSTGVTLRPPSNVDVRSFLCPFFTSIKLCFTKALEWSSLVPGA